MESFWKWHVIPENLHFFAMGFRLTLVLFGLAWVGCWAFAVVLGAMRHSERWWLRYPAAGVIEVIRGTPGIMFVVWVYFLSQPLVGYALSPFWAAVWALLIHNGAYGAEVVRAGLNSIPRGQVAAGYSTGLNYLQVMGHIVLPQALRNMAPAIVNRSVALFKNTSLAFVIGVIEFFRSGTIVNGRENASFSVFTFIAVVYFVCCFSLSRLGHRLGQRPGVIEDTTAV
ncbi:MAG: amino acid ABC transporter permease [Candidatus Tectomicrobia bacterium]|nr:amino acid ABC transporter permease [Candidatus Tectomicrobia bacterium]